MKQNIWEPMQAPQKKRRIWVLTKSAVRGNIGDKERWIPCPVCGKKRFYHLLPGAAGKNIAVYCGHCKQEIVFHIPADEGRQNLE